MVDIDEVTATPGPDLLTPDNCAVLFVDHQPQMFFGTGSGDRTAIINAAVGLAKAARVFDVPVVLSTVAAESFSGPLLPPLADVFPDHKIVDRTTMNAWEDVAFVEAVKATGRKKLVIAGLWTEVCVVLPALSALAQGYEVYVVTDASGGVTPQAHEHAVQRMIQAGCRTGHLGTGAPGVPARLGARGDVRAHHRGGQGARWRLRSRDRLCAGRHRRARGGLTAHGRLTNGSRTAHGRCSARRSGRSGGLCTSC